MLRARVLSAVFGVPLILVAVFLGGGYLLGLMAALALAGFSEFAGMVGHNCSTGLTILGHAACIVIPVTAFAVPEYVSLTVMGTIITMLSVQVLSKGSYSIMNVFNYTFGCVYVSLPLSALLVIRSFRGGAWLCASLFAVVWATDVTAYFSGMVFGQKPLLPEISPHKTWEGALMGLLAAVVTGAALSHAAGFSTLFGTVTGFAIGVAGQIGDLAESSIKRYSGVKDSGQLIPGHGGILDRFDSLLFAAPVYYFILRLAGF